VGEQVQRLEALAAVGRRLGTATTRARLVDLAVRAALEVLDADSASIAVLEADRGMLRVLRNAGALAPWEQERPVDERYPVADLPRLAVSAEHVRPCVGHRDDPTVGDAHLALLARMGMDSSLSLPIVVGDQVWGEIGAARRAGRDRFGPEDLPVGLAFAGMLAAAVGGLDHHDELRRLAYHDPLTGLANRRSVDEHLEALFSGPSRRTVAVVLCDVDGLKLVNDRHGHHLGDRLLRDVALLLSREASAHPGALAGRIGGDEFALILEDVDDAEVAAIASRLVAAAAGLPLGGGLSCGSALTHGRPGDAPTATGAARALLRLADAAQYRAKRAGRGPITAGQEPVTSELGPTDTVGLVDGALAALRSRVAVAGRLEAMTASLAAGVDAAAWAVSLSEDGGPATVVVNDDALRLGRSDEHAVQPGTAYELAAYPATAAALDGGSFHVTLEAGEPTEREFLAAHAYDELLAAGTSDGSRRWLVELCGDASTRSLRALEPLLRVLVELAVHGHGGPTADAAAVRAMVTASGPGSSG
jgi:diguanylate cyclase (GGDEF)-like protein